MALRHNAVYLERSDHIFQVYKFTLHNRLAYYNYDDKHGFESTFVQFINGVYTVEPPIVDPPK